MVNLLTTNKRFVSCEEITDFPTTYSYFTTSYSNSVYLLNPWSYKLNIKILNPWLFIDTVEIPLEHRKQK